MKWTHSLLIFVACVVAYGNSFENSFHYDDEHSIQKNIHLRDMGNLGRFFVDPSTFSVDETKGMYRPLLVASFALNHWAGGYDVWGYHLVNVLIHATAACLLMVFLWALGAEVRIGLWAGLLFAVHPICSEPVNYISSRSESLAGLFYVGGLASFALTYARKATRFRPLGWACMTAGLLSKSSAITLPAALLLLDGLILCRGDLRTLARNALQRHTVYWAIALAYVLVIVFNRFLTTSLDKRVRGMDEQLPTQIKALAYYAKLLVWPNGLNVEHQFFVSRIDDATVYAPLVGLLCFALILYGIYRKGQRTQVFFALWGMVSLLPVLLMPLNVLVNERRLYLPAAALCALLAFWLHHPSLRRRAAYLGGGILLVFFLLTWQRNAVWATDFTLWEDAISKAPKMPRVHLYWGNAHKDAAFAQQEGSQAAQRHWNEARGAFHRAIELQPRGDLALRALNNLGAVSFVLQDVDAAEQAYRRAVELNPEFADALVNLGTIYHDRGRRAAGAEGVAMLRQSVEYYRRALQQLPNHADAWANMGLAYGDMGDWDNARQAYERAYFLNPRNVRLLTNFGNYYATIAQKRQGAARREAFEQARTLYRQAIALNPAYAVPRNGLRFVEEALGQ